MKYLNKLILISAIIGTAACGQNVQEEFTPTPESTQVIQDDSTNAPNDNPNNPVTLILWVPPQFGLEDSPGYVILQERLTLFSERRPGVRVEIRVKGLDGPASLYESLVTTSNAVPLALPDLAVFDINDLEKASADNLIFPMDEVLTEPIVSDLFEFGKEISTIDENVYVLPFAIDALILVYRTNAIDSVPTSWNNLLETRGPLAFAAGDPNSLFSILLYQAQGKRLEIGEENPVDQKYLEEIFQFYKSGQETNLFPFWLTQFEDEEVIWQAFREGQAQMAIVWSHTYLSNQASNIRSTFIPTLNGTPYTLATGWAWGVTTPIIARQELATELAVFLSEGEFTGEWSTETNYFPAINSGFLTLPQESLILTLANQVLPFADSRPSTEILEAFGEIFRENTISILKLEKSPSQAIEDILGKIGQ